MRNKLGPFVACDHRWDCHFSQSGVQQQVGRSFSRQIFRIVGGPCDQPSTVAIGAHQKSIICLATPRLLWHAEHVQTHMRHDPRWDRRHVYWAIQLPIWRRASLANETFFRNSCCGSPNVEFQRELIMEVQIRHQAIHSLMGVPHMMCQNYNHRSIPWDTKSSLEQQFVLKKGKSFGPNIW